MEGQIQFISLNKKLDWENGKSWNMEVSDLGLSLKQVDKYVLDKTIKLAESTIRAPIVQFTLGGTGTLFLLDKDTNLWKYDIENDYVERLFSAGHELFSKDALLTCSGNTLFIVDPMSDYVSSAFSISNGQILWSRSNWDGEMLKPLAMVKGERGSVYLLLASEYHTHHIVRLWSSGQMDWLIAYNSESPIDLNADRMQKFALAVNSFDEPIVFDTVTREIRHFNQRGALIKHYCMLQPSFCSNIALDSNDHIYIGDQRDLVLGEEDTRYLFQIQQNGDLYTRLPAYRGRTDKIMIDEKDRLYIWNEWEQTLSILSLKPRTMELDRTGLLSGVYLTTALDSGSSEMEWHKIFIDAEIPEETQLRIFYYASDRKTFFYRGNQVEIDSIILDNHQSMDEIVSPLAELYSGPIVNPKDALFLKAKGRYIWLKIELVGSEQHTPLLKKMRVYYPRMSLLSYLPSVYQEDEKSKDFLERFLSLFGTFLFDMEEKIEKAPSYFDADRASGPFLKWLASWLGIHVDEEWDDTQIRELIHSVPELYRLRGTRWAIERIVEIYTGEKPMIIEHFQYKQMMEMSDLSDLAGKLYGDNPYQFSVLVKSEHVRTEKKRRILEKVLNEQKPAFTEARLVVLEPWVYIDMHTYLGINTYLSEPSLMRLDHQSSMPNNTVLIDVDQDNRIGVHTRLALDAQLE